MSLSRINQAQSSMDSVEAFFSRNSESTLVSINSFNDEFMGSILDYLDDNDFVNLVLTEKKYYIQQLFIEEIMNRFQNYKVVKVSDRVCPTPNNLFFVLSNGLAVVENNYMYRQIFPEMPQGLAVLPEVFGTHKIKDISNKCDILTESGEVIFLSYVEHVSLAEITYPVNLKHFYPDSHIVQFIEYNYRTILLDANGKVFQPAHRNINGEIVIQLSKMKTSSGEEEREYDIAKMFTTEMGLMLLTKEGHVLYAQRDNDHDHLSPILLEGPILAETVIDICSVRSINLFLTETGKVFCNGHGLHNLFKSDLFDDIPETSFEPFLVTSLLPYCIKQIIPNQGLITYALYFKTEQGESFVIGENFSNRFGDIVEEIPIKKIQLPVFDHMQLEQDSNIEEGAENNVELEEIIDARIYPNCGWYLTNTGFLYYLNSDGYKKLGMDERIIKLESKGLGNRGDNFKLYALTEKGTVFLYGGYHNDKELYDMSIQDVVMRTNKPYKQLTTMVSALQRQGLFSRMAAYSPQVELVDEPQSGVESSSYPSING
ncbi:MAG: hypothetical protein P4M12_08800 [Gammaproteobacteria bacterium]|nr:hypothetical protein [Gammaproteobacteria bacterium]